MGGFPVQQKASPFYCGTQFCMFYCRLEKPNIVLYDAAFILVDYLGTRLNGILNVM